MRPVSARYPFMYGDSYRSTTPLLGHIGEYDLYAHGLYPPDDPHPITGWLVLTKGLATDTGITRPRPREIKIKQRVNGEWVIEGETILGWTTEGQTHEDREALHMFLEWLGLSKDGVGDALERLKE